MQRYVDYGNTDSFESVNGTFLLEGDWGWMEVSAARVEVTISD